MILAFRPSPVRTACSTHFSLITGSMPGNPASMNLTWLLGSAAEFGRGAGKQLGLGKDLGMDFHADHDLPIAGFALEQFVLRGSVHTDHHLAGECLKSAACSTARGRAQHCRLVKRLADQLQPQRQAVRGQAGRHRNPRQAGQVHRHGEDVLQIHLHRIRGLGADAEGRTRGRGREQHVAFLERLLEVALDQAAQLLGAGIIGVVIAGRQHIGADQDAALHFRAEALRPGFSRKAR